MKGIGKGKSQGAQSDGVVGLGLGLGCIPSSADLEVTIPFANENHVGFL